MIDLLLGIAAAIWCQLNEDLINREWDKYLEKENCELGYQKSHIPGPWDWWQSIR